MAGKKGESWDLARAHRVIDRTIAAVAAEHKPGGYCPERFKKFNDDLLKAINARDMGEVHMICFSYLRKQTGDLK